MAFGITTFRTARSFLAHRLAVLQDASGIVRAVVDGLVWEVANAGGPRAFVPSLVVRVATSDVWNDEAIAAAGARVRAHKSVEVGLNAYRLTGVPTEGAEPDHVHGREGQYRTSRHGDEKPVYLRVRDVNADMAEWASACASIETSSWSRADLARVCRSRPWLLLAPPMTEVLKGHFDLPPQLPPEDVALWAVSQLAGRGAGSDESVSTAAMMASRVSFLARCRTVLPNNPLAKRVWLETAGGEEPKHLRETEFQNTKRALNRMRRRSFGLAPRNVAVPFFDEAIALRDDEFERHATQHGRPAEYGALLRWCGSADTARRLFILAGGRRYALDMSKGYQQAHAWAHRVAFGSGTKSPNLP